MAKKLWLNLSTKFSMAGARAGSRIVRIDPFHFLAGCHKSD